MSCEFIFEITDPDSVFAATVEKAKVVEEQCVVIGGGTQGVEDEASIVGERIEIADGACELNRVQLGRPIHHFVAVERG